MDEEQLKSIMKEINDKLDSKFEEISNKLDKKFDESIEKLNKKVIENETEISNMKETNKATNEKLDNVIAQSDLDHDQIIDNTERIDKVDSNIRLMEIRLKETENSIDEINKNESNNPKLNKLEKDIQELKNNMTKKSYSEATKVNESEQEKTKSSPTNTTPTTKVNNNFTPPKKNEDIFKEARGKVGLYPIGIEQIREFVKDDSDDVEIMTKFQHIEARHSAAQDFLSKQMHFQFNEIKIQTIKMARNWSSNIMWIEVGEENVNRLINRSINLKNPNIQLITYYPAQVWSKRKEINEIMKEVRKKIPDIRYQIKLGKSDIFLRTKMVDEFVWQNTPVEHYAKMVNRSLVSDAVLDSPIFKRLNKQNICPDKTSPQKKKTRNVDSSI